MELGSGFREILDAERALMGPDVYAIGSMLSYDERLLLHWAARTAGPGAIVDLGSFLGGSTLALARGAEERAAAIDAFDLFTCRGENENTWAPVGSNLSLGDPTRPIFERNIAAVADRVTVHEGDIRDATWNDPIGLLFIDITKGWASGDAVWRTFLSRVRPDGLVIQQDLVHWGHPWCAIIMECLAADFEYLGWVSYSSAVYRCRRTPAEVPVPLLDHLNCDEALALLDAAARRVGGSGAVMIRLAAPMVYAAYGRFDEALAVVEQFRGTYDNEAVAFIEEGFAYLDEWLADAQAGRTPWLRDIAVPRS